MGRRLFGAGIKYPLFRLGHVPERFLRRRLYLDLSRNARLRAPDHVPIPEHRLRVLMPESEGLLL